MTKHSTVSIVMLVLIFAVGVAALFAFPKAQEDPYADGMPPIHTQPVKPNEPKPTEPLQTLGPNNDKPFPTNTAWQWVRTVDAGGGIEKPKPGTTFEIRFDGAGRFTVRGDCNSIGGQYVVWGPGDVSMDNIMMTEMYCEGSQEVEFVSTLSRTTAYEIKDSTLILTIEGDMAGYGSMIFSKIN